MLSVMTRCVCAHTRACAHRAAALAALRAPPPAEALSPASPDRLTRTRVRELLDRHGLDPSRALGQNFLCDPGMVDKIVRLARVGPGDAVVEIGPGIGSLTLGLVDAGAEVVAVELDAHLLPVLDEVIGGRGVTVVHGDATTIDWSATLDAVDPDPDRRWSVVAKYNWCRNHGACLKTNARIKGFVVARVSGGL